MLTDVTERDQDRTTLSRPRSKYRVVGIAHRPERMGSKQAQN